MAPGSFHSGLETFDPFLPRPLLCSGCPDSQYNGMQLSSFEEDGCIPHSWNFVLENTITFHKKAVLT